MTYQFINPETGESAWNLTLEEAQAMLATVTLGRLFAHDGIVDVGTEVSEDLDDTLPTGTSEDVWEHAISAYILPPGEQTVEVVPE